MQTKIEIAREVTRRACAATGEAYDEKAAQRLADANTTANLRALLADAKEVPGGGTSGASESPLEVAKPWLRFGARVRLPALEPGECEEFPDGLPAETAKVLEVHGEVGTVLVEIEGSGEQQLVSGDDLELPPDPGEDRPHTFAAEVAAQKAEQLARAQRRLRLAEKRLASATREVERLKATIAGLTAPAVTA